MNPVDFYVFSGTGNTWLAAERVCRTLQEGGVGAEMKPLERSAPEAVDPQRTLGIAFPVACFATYPLVLEFLRRLPAANGGGVILLDTLGGNSGNFPGRLRGLFLEKGYTLLGAAEILMPDNIFGKGSLSGKQQAVLQKGLASAENFARALLAGQGTWPEAGRLGAVWDKLGGMAFSWRLGQRFRPKVRQEACTGCGLCARLCPAHNITMEQGRAVIAPHCQYCLRCRGLCPAGAIGLWPTRPYRSVNWPEILDV